MNFKIIKRILMNEVANKSFIPTRIRIFLLRICGIRIANASIRSHCYFEGSNVIIGKGTWINNKCHFDADEASITLGENIAVGMEVLFCTSTHKIGDTNARASESVKLSIEVKNGCWIGARALILPGVSIGEGCIIAAGSVITKDCEANGLYAGIPATRIKDIS